MSFELHHGDCLQMMRTLPDNSVDAVVTSPPYAMQRAKLYGGIPEKGYPAWTVAWMDALRPALKERGSVLINIREHIKDGQISDYVHRTRLAVRDAGWFECEELIWFKTDAPPLGSVDRPRRAWERVLWFSATKRPFVSLRDGGKPSKRLGGLTGDTDLKLSQWLHKGQAELKEGIARIQDVACVPISCNEVTPHPAAYPKDFAAWMLKLVCPVGGTVCDPFTGSGTTGVAAIETGRNFIGCELDEGYFNIAKERIERAANRLQVAAPLTARPVEAKGLFAESVGLPYENNAG